MNATEQAFFACVRQKLAGIFEQSAVPEYVVGYGSRLALFELLERCDALAASRLAANGMTVSAHVHVLSANLYDAIEYLRYETGTRHDQSTWFTPINEMQWRASVSELKGRYYELQGWLSFEFDPPSAYDESHLLEL